MNDKEALCDAEADSLCKWAAARAGAMVWIPGWGAGALVVNEIYMICRLGDVYGTRITSTMAKGFILAFGATIAGQTLASFIPGLNVVIAISVTYGIGKAGKAWIKDGMPKDISKYKDIYEEQKKQAKANADSIKNDPRRHQPLGDESKKM